MSNFPNLSEGAITLLIDIDHQNWIGGRPILPDTKERRELKKHRLIYSRPLNDNPLLPAAGGHGRRWCPTEFGAELAKAFRRERAENEPKLETAIKRAARERREKAQAE